MMEKIITQGKVLPKDETKTAFISHGAINSPSPQWAKYMFRSVAVVTTILAFWIAGTSLVQESHKVEIMLALKSVDMLTLAFSKMFGIVPDK